MAVAALALLVGVAVCGCSSGSRRRAAVSAIDVAGSLAVHLHYSRAPVRELPALPTDVVMLDAADGVLVGDGGPGANVGNGASFSLGTGVIERTSDGGAHWRTVLSARLTDFTWVGRDGSDLVAAGVGLRSLALVLARSDDGGLHWTVTRPRVLDRHGAPPWGAWQSLAFSGHGAALAAPQDQLEGPNVAPLADGVLRSGDDGRVWRVVRLPDGGQANGQVTWSADGKTAYVTGDSDMRRCPTALWRSEDAGVSWQLVRGACSLPDVFAVAFSDPLHGLIGGGYDPVCDSLQFIARTSDAGAHWHIVWRAPTRRQARRLICDAGPRPIVALTSAGARTAWAVPGGTHPGAAASYVGAALVTRDGGSHWRDTDQLASAIGPLADGAALAVVPVDPKAPLAALARTSDGGASWTELASLDEMEGFTLLGRGRQLSDVTSAGTFTSGDDGVTWRALDVPVLDRAFQPLAVLPGLIATQSPAGCTLRISRDGGRTWHTARTPAGCVPDGVAFADSSHALALAGHGTCNGDRPELVQRSDDGGLSWHAAGSIPDFGAGETAVAVSGRLAVAVGGGCDRIAISADDARTWSVRAVRSPLTVDGVAARAHDLWVLCDVNTPNGGRTTILHTTNAGHTWQAERFPDPITVQALVATGPGQATAMIANAFSNATFGSPDAALWRTTDGGASWTQSWPALPLE